MGRTRTEAASLSQHPPVAVLRLLPVGPGVSQRQEQQQPERGQAAGRPPHRAVAPLRAAPALPAPAGGGAAPTRAPPAPPRGRPPPPTDVPAGRGRARPDVPADAAPRRGGGQMCQGRGRCAVGVRGHQHTAPQSHAPLPIPRLRAAQGRGGEGCPPQGEGDGKRWKDPERRGWSAALGAPPLMLSRFGFISNLFPKGAEQFKASVLRWLFILVYSCRFPTIHKDGD